MVEIDGKVICITGALPIPRRIAVEKIVKNGGIFAAHVTKCTDILVVGVFPFGRTSTTKYGAANKWIARGYPIKLISSEEFLASFNRDHSPTDTDSGRSS